jgi:hypothetical protein
MMISEKLAEAMSLQVGREMTASNQYLVIATYFEREMLDQLAGFFYRQAAEEHEHALKFVHYVTGAGGKVVLPAWAPRHDITSAEMAAQLSLDWENDKRGKSTADGSGREGDDTGAGFPGAGSSMSSGRSRPWKCCSRSSAGRPERAALRRNLHRRPGRSARS